MPAFHSSNPRIQSDAIQVAPLSSPPLLPLVLARQRIMFGHVGAFRGTPHWLGLCPEKKINGGKVLFTKSRRVRSRVATALHIGAQSLHHAKDYLGEFFRRITRKLGKPQAITATAHKLARIVFHVLSTKEPYDENVFCRSEAETLKRAETRLRLQAAHLGFQIIPTNN